MNRLTSSTNGTAAPELPSFRSNAVNAKLNSVLATSYLDTSLRDALKLYDARYASSINSSKIDLKYEAQRQVIAANSKIIDDFSEVVKQLDRVEALVDALKTTCEDIDKHVLAAKQETAPMLEEASTLLAQRDEVQVKQQLLGSFNQHFLLKDEDLEILTSPAIEMNDDFFQILARVKEIHKGCELLLGQENQRLGLELLEQTTRMLDAGYKKLYNWTVREFRGLDLEDPQVGGSIRRCLRALSERPSLFQSCLDNFAEARQATVSEGFQQALSQTSAAGSKAIEFSTHDPLRYLGDMLAWVHSATVSEMEALEGLFIADGGELGKNFHQNRLDPWTRAAETDVFDDVDEEDLSGEQIVFDGQAALNSLISRNMASVAHTLTQRVSVTVRSLTDPLEIYKAFNILAFYHDMFEKLMRLNKVIRAEDNTLLNALAEMQNLTFKHFENSALEQTEAGIDSEPAEDLGPPEVLSAALSQYSKIVAERGPVLTQDEEQRLYSILLQPVLDACADLADLAEPSSVSANSHKLIYKLNYLGLTQSAVRGIIPSGIGSLSKVLDSMKPLIVSLSKDLSQTLLSSSRLTDLSLRLEALNHYDQPQNAAVNRRLLLEPAETSTNLDDLAERLDSFLSSALIDTQELYGLAKLRDKQIANGILEEATASFVEKFEEVVRVLEDIDEAVDHAKLHQGLVNGIGNSRDADEEEKEDHIDDSLTLREVYPRTVEEVEALLT